MKALPMSGTMAYNAHYRGEMVKRLDSRRSGVPAHPGRRAVPRYNGGESVAYKWTPEHHANYRKARLGVSVHNEDSRARMSAAHKGVPLSPEHAAHVADSVRGRPRKPLTPEQRKRIGDGIQAEKQFMQAIVDLARRYGWLVYHTWFSGNSAPGFPDLICLRANRVLAIECKKGRAKVTPAQQEWLEAFDRVCEHIEAYVARSDHHDLDQVERLLR